MQHRLSLYINLLSYDFHYILLHKFGTLEILPGYLLNTATTYTAPLDDTSALRIFPYHFIRLFTTPILYLACPAAPNDEKCFTGNFALPIAGDIPYTASYHIVASLYAYRHKVAATPPNTVKLPRHAKWQSARRRPLTNSRRWPPLTKWFPRP
jgi:hypothetical protein